MPYIKMCWVQHHRLYPTPNVRNIQRTFKPSGVIIPIYQVMNCINFNINTINTISRMIFLFKDELIKVIKLLHKIHILIYILHCKLMEQVIFCCQFYTPNIILLFFKK